MGIQTPAIAGRPLSSCHTLILPYAGYSPPQNYPILGPVSAQIHTPKEADLVDVSGLQPTGLWVAQLLEGTGRR